MLTVLLTVAARGNDSRSIRRTSATREVAVMDVGPYRMCLSLHVLLCYHL